MQQPDNNPGTQNIPKSKYKPKHLYPITITKKNINPGTQKTSQKPNTNQNTFILPKTQTPKPKNKRKHLLSTINTTKHTQQPRIPKHPKN